MMDARRHADRPDRPGPARPCRAALADAARPRLRPRAARCAACRRWAATTSTAPRGSRRSSAGAGDRGPAGHRRAQRRLHHGRALGARRPGARCTARCSRRRRTSSRRCPRATRRWTRCAPAAGCRCRASRCRSPASSRPAATIRSAATSASPTLARGWGSALVDLGEVGHLNPASGYGDWPQAEHLRSTRARGRCAASTRAAARPRLHLERDTPWPRPSASTRPAAPKS